MTLNKIEIERTKKRIKKCNEKELREITSTMFEYLVYCEENMEKCFRNHESLVRQLVKTGVIGAYESIDEIGIVKQEMHYLDQFGKN
jgi:hypothetical protein